MNSVLKFTFFALLIFITTNCFGQVPVISYPGSPATFTAGIPVNSVSPAGSGVAAFGYSSTTTSIGSGLSAPGGLAIDAAGNIYVADAGNNAVKKIAAGTGVITILGSGFNKPNDVKVDAAGNVYVADSGNGAVKEIKTNGTTVTLAAVFNSPQAIALDASGNIYVADTNNNLVKVIPVGGGNVITLNYNSSTPTGIAVDNLGNIYVSNGINDVYEIPASGGNDNPGIDDNASSPKGIITDAAGNVYIADSGNGTIDYYPAGSFGANPLSIEFSKPSGIAVDASGNIYIADASKTFISKVVPVGGFFLGSSLPASLKFSSATGVISGTANTASAAANYKVTAYNATGSSSATINIKVILPALPVISYSAAAGYTAGTAITALIPTSSGVSDSTYSKPPKIIGSGFNGNKGVAIDKAGNVYVADAGNNAVKMIPGGTGTPVVIGSGFNQPTGVAVDAAGNVYVADWGNSLVKKIPGGTGTPVSIGTGFGQPFAIAVDAAGNVFVGDQGRGPKEIIAATGATVSLILQSNPLSSNITGGIAVDGAGNVYFDDISEGYIAKIPFGGGSPVFLNGILSFPYGIAVDGSGNVYIANSNNTANNIVVIPANGSSNFTIGTDLNSPVGLAISGSGNLYIGDTGNNAVKEINPIGGYFITPNLPAGLNFNLVTGTISGTPTVASAATTYTVTGYNSGGGKAAIISLKVALPAIPSISYASPKTFTAGTAIPVLAPTSKGVDAAGYGIIPTSYGSGFNGPEGVAADAAGNIYVADASNNAIKKIAAGNGAITILGSGFISPSDVAVDAAGNVYVADKGNNAVKKIAVSTGAITSLGTGFNGPFAIALDAAGNIYVADSGNNAIKEINTGTGTTVTLGTGFNNPKGVTVDAAGNIYVSDTGNGLVKMIAAGTGTITTLGSGFNEPAGIAVDAAGNIFVADEYFSSNVLKEIITEGGTVVTVCSDFNQPIGIALDASGNIYVADYGNNIIKKVFPVGGYYLSTALPAGLSFSNSTGAISGTPTITSVAKNYTVTAYNYGGSKSAIVNIAISPAASASLSALKISNVILSPVFGGSTITYTASVGIGVTSVTVTPTVSGTSATATIKINGTAVTSGAASAAIPLNVGTNVISAVVTSNDGTFTSIYTVTITRAPSTNAYLSFMKLTGSGTVLTPAFAFKTFAYTANAPYTTTSVTVLPTTYVNTSTMKVNGVTLASGTASRPIFLNVGSNTINITVTAQDGVTKETYTITVTRTLSNNAYLSYMRIIGAGAVLSPAFTFTDTTYTASVPNTTTSVTVKPTTYVTTSIQTVNGTALASGATSPAIPLNVGSNAINVVVAAQDGVTTLTYTITVTRAAGADNSLYQAVGVENPLTQPQLTDDGLTVHQAVSPNGDGINDFLTIENISNYPDNKLLIMNRDGQMVFESKNYDNSTRVFDGHSNKTGQMQLPGTYFYALDYTVKGITKHKTGFLVLKY